jgi:shikimate kinase
MQNVLLENDALLKVVTDGNGVIQLGGGLEGATAYALAARQLLLDTVDVTFDLAKKIKEAREANVPTTDLRAAYVQQLFAFETIQSTVNNIANESGRLMQSFNVNIGNTAKSKFLSEMLDTAGKDIDELIEGMTRDDIRSVEDRIKTFKNMQEEDGPLSKIKSAIGEYWYNSILSAPDTNVVNTFGNLGVQLARTAIEGTIGATRGQLRLMGSRLTGSDVDPASVMYLLGSTIDYKKEVFGSYFTVSNPASTSSCGCGESIGF